MIRLGLLTLVVVIISNEAARTVVLMTTHWIFQSLADLTAEI